MEAQEMQSEQAFDNSLILETIKNLPPLPATVIELKKYIDTSGANLEIPKVADIISKDPLLVGKLLQLVNSPFYGLSRQVSTIPQVISLLGVTNVKNIILADSVKSNFSIDVSPYGIDTPKFLKSCSQEVDFISSWLTQEDKILANMLIPCVMLLRLGIILLSSILIKSKHDQEFLEENKANNYNNIHQIEEKYCGIDSLSFLGFLFDYWKFDETLIQSIAHINNPHSAPDEVKKNAYALAIVNSLFVPFNSSSSFNSQKAVALINEAKTHNINFDIDNFLNKLPDEIKAILEHTEE